MVSVLAKTINKNKGVLFIEPYILNKDTLLFKDNTLSVKSFFNIKDNYVSIDLAGGIYGMEIDKEDVEALKKFHQNELNKATNYFNSLTQSIEMWISGDNVCNKTLIDMSFNPYYVQLTLFALNKSLNTKKTNLDEFKDILLKKKTKLKEFEKYGEFTVVTL